MDNNKELKKLMRKHGLTRQQVANLSMVALSTVDRWLAPRWITPSLIGKHRRGAKEINPTFRNLPDSRLSLFRLKLVNKESSE